MAIKTFHVLKDMKHPLYRNRMLRAGQPLELDAGTAALYQRLGVIGSAPAKRAVPEVVSGKSAPKRAAKKRTAAPKKNGSVPAMSTANTAQTTDAGKKRPAKKRARGKKAK